MRPSAWNWVKVAVNPVKGGLQYACPCSFVLLRHATAIRAENQAARFAGNFMLSSAFPVSHAKP